MLFDFLIEVIKQVFYREMITLLSPHFYEIGIVLFFSKPWM